MEACKYIYIYIYMCVCVCVFNCPFKIILQSKHDGVQGINIISNGRVVNIVNVTYNLKGDVPGKFHSSGGSSLTATVGNVSLLFISLFTF